MIDLAQDALAPIGSFSHVEAELQPFIALVACQNLCIDLKIESGGSRGLSPGLM